MCEYEKCVFVTLRSQPRTTNRRTVPGQQAQLMDAGGICLVSFVTSKAEPLIPSQKYRADVLVAVVHKTGTSRRTLMWGALLRTISLWRQVSNLPLFSRDSAS